MVSRGSIAQIGKAVTRRSDKRFMPQRNGNWLLKRFGKEIRGYAKGVSAKSHNFDADGNETATDYQRMMKIVTDTGYDGYVGIEYEGAELSEMDGIRATKALLERVRDELGA